MLCCAASTSTAPCTRRGQWSLLGREILVQKYGPLHLANGVGLAWRDPRYVLLEVVPEGRRLTEPSRNRYYLCCKPSTAVLRVRYIGHMQAHFAANDVVRWAFHADGGLRPRHFGL